MFALIGYNSIGYYFVFRYQHQKAEKDFRDYIASTSIDESELTLFKIPVQEYAEKGGSDFSRVEGDFQQNGKFYEVVKQNLENDTVFVYCLNNEKEAALYASLYDHIYTHILDGKKSKSKKDNTTNNLLREYLPKSADFLSVGLIEMFDLKTNSNYGKTYISVDLATTSPPPKLS